MREPGPFCETKKGEGQLQEKVGRKKLAQCHPPLTKKLRPPALKIQEKELNVRIKRTKKARQKIRKGTGTLGKNERQQFVAPAASHWGQKDKKRRRILT